MSVFSSISSRPRSCAMPVPTVRFSGKGKDYQSDWQRLFEMEKAALEKFHQERYGQRLAAYKTNLQQLLISNSLMDIQVLEFQGQPISGKEYLAFVQAMIQEDTQSSRVRQVLAGVLGGVLNLGIPFLNPGYYRRMGKLLKEEGANFSALSTAFNSNKQQWIHHNVTVLLDTLKQQGYIDYAENKVGLFKMTEKRVVLTEKGRQYLASQPGLENQAMKKFKEAMLLPMAEERFMYTAESPDRLDSPANSSQFGAVFQYLQKLFFSHNNSENAWDLLRKLPDLFEARPFYSRWYSGSINEKEMKAKLGIDDERWLKEQLDSLQMLGLVNMQTRDPRCWSLTERGRTAAQQKDPFTAGLMTQAQFQQLLEYQKTILQEQLVHKESHLKAIEEEMLRARGDYAKLVLEQSRDGEKVQPIRDEQKTATADHDKKRLEVTVQLLTQRMLQRKTLMDQQARTCDEFTTRLSTAWDEYQKFAAHTQNTIHQLTAIGLKTRSITINEGLAELGEAFQALMSQQDRVLASAEAQVNDLTEQNDEKRLRQEFILEELEAAKRMEELLAEQIEAASSSKTLKNSN